MGLSGIRQAASAQVKSNAAIVLEEQDAMQATDFGSGQTWHLQFLPLASTAATSTSSGSTLSTYSTPFNLLHTFQPSSHPPIFGFTSFGIRFHILRHPSSHLSVYLEHARSSTHSLALLFNRFVFYLSIQSL